MKEKMDIHIYDDIIRLPHHVSATRPHMSLLDRAAQFSPFAALTGYDSAMKETARLTERRMELSEDEKSVLDRRFNILQEYIGEQPKITGVYFVPDAKKDGGRYDTVTALVKKLDVYRGVLIMKEGSEIPIEKNCRTERVFVSGNIKK